MPTYFLTAVCKIIKNFIDFFRNIMKFFRKSRPKFLHFFFFHILLWKNVPICWTYVTPLKWFENILKNSWKFFSNLRDKLIENIKFTMSNLFRNDHFRYYKIPLIFVFRVPKFFFKYVFWWNLTRGFLPGQKVTF